MKTKETNISPWLHSIQQTFRTPGLFTTIESRQSDEFASRIDSTREKINSVLNTFYALEERSGVNLTSYHGRIGNMIAIRDAIGVYGIYHPTHSRRERQPNMVWHSYTLMKEVIISPKEGKEWLDYFGQDDGITEVGGYVVVSLSDKGIEYLNGIREKVSYWSSSPDKRYYTTVTI
jgi:hypothetical protein